MHSLSSRFQCFSYQSKMGENWSWFEPMHVSPKLRIFSAPPLQEDFFSYHFFYEVQFWRNMVEWMGEETERRTAGKIAAGPRQQSQSWLSYSCPFQDFYVFRNGASSSARGGVYYCSLTLYWGCLEEALINWPLTDEGLAITYMDSRPPISYHIQPGLRTVKALLIKQLPNNGAEVFSLYNRSWSSATSPDTERHKGDTDNSIQK
jgi:hypothetical protein